MEIKYTNDGKKVVVIGNLNSQEKIVQEVFIVNGNEVPSGENFVVKSLHDSPAKSWKETRLEEIEQRYEKEYKENEFKLENLRKTFNATCGVISEKIRSNRMLEKNMKPEDLNILIDFITGNIKYLLIDTYGSLEIVEFDKSIIQHDYYGHFEAIKLLSVLGRSDGNLEYRLHQYSDGSGGSHIVTPFKDRESALQALKDKFFEKLSNCKNGLSNDLIKTAEKYGIEIPKPNLDIWNAEKLRRINDNIKKLEESLEGYKQQKKNLTTLTNQ